jgi:hypothetical protein
MTTMMTLRDVKQNSSPGHDHACSSVLEEISVSLRVVVTLARCKCLSFPLLARVHLRVSLPSLNLVPLVFVACLSCRPTEATTCGDFGRRTGLKGGGGAIDACLRHFLHVMTGGSDARSALCFFSANVLRFLFVLIFYLGETTVRRHFGRLAPA